MIVVPGLSTYCAYLLGQWILRHGTIVTPDSWFGYTVGMPLGVLFVSLLYSFVAWNHIDAYFWPLKKFK